MDVHDVVAAARQDDMRLIRFEYCDVSGVARLEGHPRRPAGAQAGRGREPHPRPDGDQRAGAAGRHRGHGAGRRDPARPRPRHLHRRCPGRRGARACSATRSATTGRTGAPAPRSYLKGVVARAAGLGVHVQATFENEYYLARDLEERDALRPPRPHPGLQPDRPRPQRRDHGATRSTRCRPRASGRAGDQRVRPGSAGDLHPAHRRPRRGGQPDEVPRHRAGCRPPARAVRLVRAQAVPRPDRQRRARAPVPVGRRRAAAASTTPPPPAASRGWAGTSSPASPSTCPRSWR